MQAYEFFWTYISRQADMKEREAAECRGKCNSKVAKGGLRSMQQDSSKVAYLGRGA